MNAIVFTAPFLKGQERRNAARVYWVRAKRSNELWIGPFRLSSSSFVIVFVFARWYYCATTSTS